MFGEAIDLGYVLFGLFRVARRGAARMIKRLVILFVPCYTAGLPRFDTVSPGHERPGETGAKRGNPAVKPVQIKWPAALSIGDI